jgi:hypothetical protein
MSRSRTRSALLGLGILLVNVAVVVAIVWFTSGRTEGGIELPPSAAHGASTTPAPTTSAAGPTDPASVAGAADLATADRAITISVLGDGTGDEDGEWVQVLARMLGETRRVTLRTLDESDPTRYTGKETFGTDGPATTIYNGSRKGSSADYAAPRLDFLVPKKPDVVILNYGRDDTASDIAEQLSGTYDAIRSAWPSVPVLVTLQAQDRDDAIEPVRATTEEWATEHGLPTIDVAGAFAQVGDPNRFVSVLDPPSVNSKGGRLWARTVLAALGGDVSAYPDDGTLPEGWDPPAVEPTGTATSAEG